MIKERDQRSRVREEELDQMDAIRQLKQELGHYFTWYNQERPHQGLDDATPDEVYFDQPLTQAA